MQKARQPVLNTRGIGMCKTVGDSKQPVLNTRGIGMCKTVGDSKAR